MAGRSPSGSGYSPKGGAAKASPAKPSIPNAECRNCAGEQWVCENHRDRAWPTVCECGAGAPCPVCRPDMANAWLLGLLRRAHDRIDSMERDCPELIDDGHFSGKPDTLLDDLERGLNFYARTLPPESPSDA